MNEQAIQTVQSGVETYLDATRRYPTHAVRGPKYTVTQGKTPVLNEDEARHLLESIRVSHVVGLRDRALIGVLLDTFARVEE